MFNIRKDRVYFIILFFYAKLTKIMAGLGFFAVLENVDISV